MNTFIHCSIPESIMKMIVRCSELLKIVNAEDSDNIPPERHELYVDELFACNSFLANFFVGEIG